MYLIRTVPLTPLPAHTPSVFDYFWTEDIAIGAIVGISLGRRTVPAVVLSSDDIRRVKLAVKSSSFELKKISSIISASPQITSAQLRLAQWISEYYACSFATAMKTVAPPFIGRRGKQLQLPLNTNAPTPENQRVVGALALTQPDTFELLARKAAAHSSGHILILTPDITTASHIAHRLQDLHPITIHSELSAKNYFNAYVSTCSKKPEVFIGTRTALSFPWYSLAHIIVEDPLNESYKSEMSPRTNAPDVARFVASQYGAELTWCTPSQSTVHHHLVGRKSIELSDQKPYWPTVQFVSMPEERATGNTSLFSRRAQTAILDAYEARTPLLVLSPRKGFATIARCSACKRPHLCATCDIPMRWHRTSEDMLVCYHCTAFIRVPRQCPLCRAGSYAPSGIPGSQKLATGIKSLLDRFGFSIQNIPILDSDLVRTRSGEQEIFQSYEHMEQPMLVATSMIFPHRYARAFTTIIVPSLDALSLHPDFRSQERLIAYLEKLADFTPKEMIVQSIEEQSPIGNIANRDWSSFYETELIQRKQFQWPPFARLIKLTYKSPQRIRVQREGALLADKLSRVIATLGAQKTTTLLGPNPALVEHANGVWRQHIILRTTLSSARLREMLHYIPPPWSIDVDPRSIA